LTIIHAQDLEGERWRGKTHIKSPFSVKTTWSGLLFSKGGKEKMKENPSKVMEGKMLIESSKKYFLRKVSLKKITAILSTFVVIMSFLVTPCLRANEPKHKDKLQACEGDIKHQRTVKQKYEGSKIKNLIEKEPQLVWQKDFGTKILRFKLHKEIDATDFPILAVETEDALIIFDKKGNEKIKRQIPRL